MIALARFYLNDEPAQAQIAAWLLMEEDVFIPKPVLLELEWVMRGAARMPPAGIARSITHLLSLDNVRVEDEAVVRAALKAYARCVDFADALHMATSAETSRFVAFDGRLAKRAARTMPRPPVVLAR